jgi:hypothetical protein
MVMKKGRLDIKKTIQKRLELRQQSIKKSNTTMGTQDDRNKLRTTGEPRPIPVGLVNRDDIRTGADIPKYVNIIPEVYQKKAFVDYDVVICIPSHERYDKVRRMILQFHEQPTKYTFKIVLLNDGSQDIQYDSLVSEFPNIFYLKNQMPNGKILHWYCYNQLWEFLRDIQCHAVLQMDDDFILSDNFLNTIVDLFFQEKEKDNKMMAIAPHTWSFKRYVEFERWWQRKDFVDGIALIDSFVIQQIKYKLKPVDVSAVSKPGTPVRAWSQISDAIKYIHGWIFRTENSLVYHDGNDDSKLHGNVRKGGKGGVYTQKYIGSL